MLKQLLLFGFIFGILSWCTLFAQTPHLGSNDYVLRGEKQSITFYPASSTDGHSAGSILYFPGDGGLHGFSITIAKSMAEMGNNVYAMDTRRYLSSFTHGDSTLKVRNIMEDLRTVSSWITQGTNEPVILVGWSAGAGLCLAAAASADKAGYAGLVTIGLGRETVLGWKLADDITYITKKMPHEPTFLSKDYIADVAPLPFFDIESTNDAFVQADTARALYQLAKQPKKFVMIEARDHAYKGNRSEFFDTLKMGLNWIRTGN